MNPAVLEKTSYVSPEPDRSQTQSNDIGDEYKNEVTQLRQEKGGQEFVRARVNEMIQTGELLEKDHPLYNKLESIGRKIKPEATINFEISKADSLEAYTVKGTETIVISAGIILGLRKFLKERKNKELAEDHLALIIGHELSHRDKESDKFRIGETYCDTNSLMLLNQAGYSLDAGVESMEFLEYIEEKAQEGRDNEEDSSKPLNITHPSSESRRVLGLVISNDPDSYLPGRYAEQTEFDQAIINDYEKSSQDWLEKQKKRFMISSNEQISEEFASATTLSQVLETFLYADDFHHAEMAQEFSQRGEFGKLLLAMALFGEMNNQKFTLLSKEDFITQFRSSLKTPTEDSNKISGDSSKKYIGKNAFSDRKLDSEQLKIIRKCLNGGYANPLQILTMDQHTLQRLHPELAKFNFNIFFSDIVESVNDFVTPSELSGRQPADLKRAQSISLDGSLNIDDYVDEKSQTVDNDMSFRRNALLHKLKVALSSSLITFSQQKDLTQWPYSHWSSFISPQIESFVSTVEGNLPDYVKLYTEVKQALLNSESCKTEQTANQIALLITSCGRYYAQPSLGGLYSHEPTLVANSPVNLQYWNRTPESDQELKTLLLNTQLALSQGGSELGKRFGKPLRIGSFENRINDTYRSLVYNTQGDPLLDPYDIFLNGETTIAIPYQNTALDRSFLDPKVNFYNELFGKYNFSLGRTEYICQTTDPNIVTRLILESKKKSDVIHAVMSNEANKQNVILIRSILEQGIAQKTLSPQEIGQMIRYVENFELSRDFLPHTDKSNRANFYQLWFDKFATENASRNLSKEN